jgi:MscS family membrane protein
LNYVKYAQRGDYETAAKYLQLTTPKDTQQGPEIARQLLVLINTSFHGSIANVSNEPKGNLEDSDDPNLEVAGTLVVENHSVPLFLARISRKDTGEIWLVSSQTLSQVPSLYQRAGSPRLVGYFPPPLMKNMFLGVPLGQWLAWLLAIPISAFIAWAMVKIGRICWNLRRSSAVQPQQSLLLGEPMIVVLTIVIDALVVLFVGMPLFYRVYYFRTLKVLLTISGAWLCNRIADLVYAHMHFIRNESRSLLQLLHHINKAVIVVFSSLIIITILGFDTKTMLAGLGIGGIAFALAAQKTLENLIGGITLVMDQTASVGDECVISGRSVTVQEIGLRSIRVLTREGTEIAFPNGMLSQTTIENVSRRTKFLSSARLTVSYECSLAQLQLVIARVREFLYSHARVETQTTSFRMIGFSTTGYQVELSAYLRCSNGTEFTAIQEDIFLHVVEIMDTTGAVWAVPSQAMYLSKEQLIDEKKMAEAEQTVRNWQTSNQVPFPDLSPDQIAALRDTVPYPAEQSVLHQRSTSLQSQTKQAV